MDSHFSQPTPGLISRRGVLRTGAMTLAAAALAPSALFAVENAPAPTAPTPDKKAAAPDGPFKLPPLPFAYDALEPHIDAETMHLHHDKHHAGYIAKLNEVAADNAAIAQMSAGEILQSLAHQPEDLREKLKNNAGGDINHSFFWQNLAKKSGAPGKELAQGIDTAFKNFGEFQAAFSKQAEGVFGSGWVWLTLDPAKKLRISTSKNQDVPATEMGVPIVGLDVWEHAYYLKYQNRRAEYIKAWWNVVNWDSASAMYVKASLSG